MKLFLSSAAFVAASLAALVTTAPAFAHSKMFESVPPSMASVDEGIEELVLKFDRKVRLTVVEVKVGEDTIEVEFPNGFVEEAVVSFEALGPGYYDWSWVAIAQDGHTMEGEGQFLVGDGLTMDAGELMEMVVPAADENEAADAAAEN